MSRQLRLAASSTNYDYVVLSGGLDLLTPTLQLRAGYVRDALNWEASINGGYTRIQGYERADGRAAPSSATYQTLTLSLLGVISPGQTIAGVTSGSTGKVLSVVGNILAFTQPTGAFVSGEALTVLGVPKATVTELGGIGLSQDYDVTQLALAANVYRALIGAVPGSGPVRGVALLAGALYAWRNNLTATALAIYKATTSGWSAVPLGLEVAFTAGTAAYTAGATLTQGGVSATIKAVSLQSGAWGSTATGQLVIAAPTGGNFAAGAATGGGAATLAGIQTAITLAPGGRVQTDSANFGGGVKLYGCDGVNRGFEFDGATLVPIATGNVPDIPKTVQVHKDHLFFGFDTNFQSSGIATPFNWSAVAGSAAFRVNDIITVMLRQPGDQSTGAMSVSTASATFMLYGSSAANFSLVPFEESAGARRHSGQRLGGQSMVTSDLGVFSLSAAQSFGNFTPSSMTLNIRPFMQTHRELVSASGVSRERSQYRVFFSDGYGLYLTAVNGKKVGAMPVFFPNDVTCLCQATNLDNQETSFFGSSNGFVYRLDAGTSHDGQPIMSSFQLTFSFQGNSRKLKRYTGVSFEVQGDSYAAFNMTFELGYAGEDRPQGSAPQDVAVDLKPSYWDSFVWDAFTWDGRNLAPSQAEMRGTGENVSMRIECNSDRFKALTINSAILHYLPRKAFKK